MNLDFKLKLPPKLQDTKFRYLNIKLKMNKRFNITNIHPALNFLQKGLKINKRNSTAPLPNRYQTVTKP